MNINILQRHLQTGRDSIRQADQLLVNVNRVPNTEDYQNIINAANQAQQAARDLNMLAGMIEQSVYK